MSDYRPCKRCGVQRLRSYQTRYIGEDIYCASCRRYMRAERSTSWMESARCAGVKNIDWFEDDDPTEVLMAVAICKDCPVRAECLRMALEEEIWHGVWGGLTPGQRTQVKVKMPHKPLVASKAARLFVTDDDSTTIYRDEDLCRCLGCGIWSVKPRLSDGLCNLCQGRRVRA